MLTGAFYYGYKSDYYWKTVTNIMQNSCGFCPLQLIPVLPSITGQAQITVRTSMHLRCLNRVKHQCEQTISRRPCTEIYSTIAVKALDSPPQVGVKSPEKLFVSSGQTKCDT